jgi:hypothetical protein
MREDFINKQKLESIFESDGIKLELGPDLGEVLWGDIHDKLVQMNNEAKEGEESWRTIEIDEFKKIGAEINKLWKEPGRNNREAIIATIVEKLGFQPDCSYWAGSCYDDGEDKTHVWSSRSGDIDYASKKTNSKARVRFVRRSND